MTTALFRSRSRAPNRTVTVPLFAFAASFPSSSLLPEAESSLR